MKLQAIFLLTGWFCASSITAQFKTELPDTVGINIHNKNFVYVAKKMKGSVTLDGVLDEPDWQTANIADNFL